MVCVVVTRGGFGDLWSLGSREEAYLHPLVQYGDAILSRPEDVADNYNQLEWNSLRRLVGLDPVPDLTTLPPRNWRSLRDVQAPQIFSRLSGLAQPAPTDPAEICRLVTRDRRTESTMAKRKADAPADVSEQKEAGERKTNLPPIAKGPKGVAQEAVITFGVDKNGVPYSAHENNPKKAGSKTHGRFAMYREGMTIQQALDAGITTADLVYDRDHGFVCFDSGATSEEASTLVEEIAHQDHAA